MPSGLALTFRCVDDQFREFLFRIRCTFHAASLRSLTLIPQHAQAMIDRASPPEHDQIVDFKSLREQVLHEIRHPDEYNGTPLQSLPILTKG